MHHCPECGKMVIAGVPHPPYWDFDLDDENDRRVEKDLDKQEG